MKNILLLLLFKTNKLKSSKYKLIKLIVCDKIKVDFLITALDYAVTCRKLGGKLFENSYIYIFFLSTKLWNLLFSDLLNYKNHFVAICDAVDAG